MKLGKVVGNVVATIKHPSHQGMKLLEVQPVDGQGRQEGTPLIAVDAACAGMGDFVLYTDEGGASRLVVGQDKMVDTVILGILDDFPYSPA